jgi:hypothetical protein
LLLQPLAKKVSSNPNHDLIFLRLRIDFLIVLGEKFHRWRQAKIWALRHHLLLYRPLQARQFRRAGALLRFR